jgi:hypothetical protein
MGERRGSMRDERNKASRTPPRSRRDFPLESPYYEEQVDPYFTDPVLHVSEEDAQTLPSDEEDWYWREPDNYWLQEGMWPWPPPRIQRKQEEAPPDEAEPPVLPEN